MTRTTYIIFLLAVTLLIVAGASYYASREEPIIIGGDRDEYGCLIAAGYAYDEEVGACIRAFELTPDLKQAARLAVDRVGRGDALTVVSFNSYEETGSYDIMLERGIEREKEIVYIRNGEVQSSQ